ncbi:ABC transporter ATP-binding protein [Dactylosporangium sp. NPDC050688]|uniref:ABC transporter ATP-binding protein n=1 Tax=Dactylosporangium sp. NPDC050688 TaxID=3157217 RepID=UPI0033D58E5A
MSAGGEAAVLELNDLRVSYLTGATGEVEAVKGVSLRLAPGETVALVGESGSGKTAVSLSALRLIPDSRARIEGDVRFRGTDLYELDPNELRRIRGARMSMVFQDPMTALNPLVRVGDQIAAALRAHTSLDRTQIRARVLELLDLVGINDVAQRARAYPDALSGGMRQRAVIALALSCQPELLIADEPTTALDVTIQAQILDLLKRLQRELSLSILLITHDLGVVAEMAQRVYVMFAGRVVESGSVDAVLTAPRHPYTQGLIAVVPRMDRPKGANEATFARSALSGVAPSGCEFRLRCPLATAACEDVPRLEPDAQGQQVACWHAATPTGRTRSPIGDEDGV